MLRSGLLTGAVSSRYPNQRSSPIVSTFDLQLAELLRDVPAGARRGKRLPFRFLEVQDPLSAHVEIPGFPRRWQAARHAVVRIGFGLRRADDRNAQLHAPRFAPALGLNIR